jgi:hypothetical protein
MILAAVLRSPAPRWRSARSTPAPATLALRRRLDGMPRPLPVKAPAIPAQPVSKLAPVELMNERAEVSMARGLIEAALAA